MFSPDEDVHCPIRFRRSMTAMADPQVQRPLKRSMLHVDAAVQTGVYNDKSPVYYSQPLSPDSQIPDEVEMTSLALSDLILIIKRSKEIADCLSLSSGNFCVIWWFTTHTWVALQRLTEIATGSFRLFTLCTFLTSRRNVPVWLLLYRHYCANERIWCCNNLETSGTLSGFWVRC